MNWTSHHRLRRRGRSLAPSPRQPGGSSRQNRVLRFESLESRRLLDASQFVINEVLVNPHGTDSGQEYIEIRATAGGAVTLPAGTYLLGIESDTYSSNPGDVQNIFNLSGLTTGSNGLLVLVQKGNSYSVAPAATKRANTGSGTGWGNGATSSVQHTADNVMVDIENTSMTLMLVVAPTAPTLATDIDADNNGTPDGADFGSWTVLDSVGLLDGVNDDLGYGAINFRMGAAGSSPGTVVDLDFNAGYVARKGSATGATADDWLAGYVGGAPNNWTLAQVSDPDYAGQALNHIGAPNPNTNPLLAHTAGSYAEGSSQAVSNADLQATDLEQSSVALRFTVNSLPLHGVLQKDGVPLNVGGNFTQADIDSGHISYTHDGGETTSDGFGFGVVDGAGGSTPGTFAITITPVNDLPTLAANLGLAINEDLLAPITASLLQVIDVDNTAEQLTYILATAPAHGTLAKNGIPLAASDSFTQHDVDLGLVTYQHNGDVALADQFTFTVADGSGGTIELATFAITITQFNLPPTIAANEATVSVTEGAVASTSGTWSDPDGDAVLLTASVGAVVNNGDGTWSWSYTPSDGPEDSQTVTITIDDGLATAQTTFALDVLNAAPALAANAGEVNAFEGETATNTGTIADVTGDVVTLTASIGTIVDNGDGTWSWSYTTGDGPEDSQTVTITADDGTATS
ncbi:MAG: cadherin-like domain-containing protein, partial [Pirellulales bacterium]